MFGADRESASMRIGLFNVKYSPNLGDGLVSESLEREIERALPGSTVVSLDLAGRFDYGEGGRFRSAALAVLERCPTFARQGFVEAILGRALRLRMRPYWRQELRTLDAVVVGGGNLFGDSDLNFPLKIDAALDETRAAGLPVAVFGVGVSDNWSPRGQDLFRRALVGVPLVHLAVRDAMSGAIWKRRLAPAGIPAARIVHDPGLLIADHVPRQPSTPDPRPLVGIGLAHPALLRYHADETTLGQAEMTAWFAAMVRACVGRGWRVALFTNGSPEDDEYLRRVGPSMAKGGGGGAVTCVPRFHRPEQLAEFVSGLDLMMAHRLHANITAYSYGVPHVGFSWDRKLKAFFERTGRSAYVCAAGQAPGAVAELASLALQSGLDPDRQRSVLAQARADVVHLGDDLRQAILARRQDQPSWRPIAVAGR